MQSHHRELKNHLNELFEMTKKLTKHVLSPASLFTILITLTAITTNNLVKTSECKYELLLPLFSTFVSFILFSGSFFKYEFKIEMIGIISALLLSIIDFLLFKFILEFFLIHSMSLFFFLIVTVVHAINLLTTENIEFCIFSLISFIALLSHCAWLEGIEFFGRTYGENLDSFAGIRGYRIAFVIVALISYRVFLVQSTAVFNKNMFQTLSFAFLLLLSTISCILDIKNFTAQLNCLMKNKLIFTISSLLISSSFVFIFFLGSKIRLYSFTISICLCVGIMTLVYYFKVFEGFLMRNIFEKSLSDVYAGMLFYLLPALFADAESEERRGFIEWIFGYFFDFRNLSEF